MATAVAQNIGEIIYKKIPSTGTKNSTSSEMSVRNKKVSIAKSYDHMTTPKKNSIKLKRSSTTITPTTSTMKKPVKKVSVVKTPTVKASKESDTMKKITTAKKQSEENISSSNKISIAKKRLSKVNPPVLRRNSIGALIQPKKSSIQSAIAKHSQSDKNNLTIDQTKKKLSGGSTKKKQEAKEKTNVIMVTDASKVKLPTPVMSSTSQDPTTEHERTTLLKDLITQAQLGKQIFSIFDKHKYIAQPVREELYKRGWLEYIPDSATLPRHRHAIPGVQTDHVRDALATIDGGQTQFTVTPPDPDTGLLQSNLRIRNFGEKYRLPMKILPFHKGKECFQHPFIEPHEVKLISELIQAQNCQVNFFWLSGKPTAQLMNFSYQPEIVNKFQKTTFCSKLGLWSNLRGQVSKNTKYVVQYPRMYNPSNEEDSEGFTLDFNMTACWSLLQWLVNNISAKGVSGVFDSNGKVPLRAFEFAVKKSRAYLKYLDTNEKFFLDNLRSDNQWSHFMYWYNAIVTLENKIKPTSVNSLNTVYMHAVGLLTQMRTVQKTFSSDGSYNLWIIKPYSAACGRGIFMTNNLSYIQHLQPRYIAQKYIERPLLIESTKFDIRQWFMVTSLRPLHIWMYDECYLRFCSLPFNLKNLHESVHLSNNAIQRKFLSLLGMNTQNMWDSHTFQTYLRLNGLPDVWERRIYSGMRDGIISALLSSQHTFDEQKNGWFEVYGADFMLTHNLEDGPWLIEINEGPAMDPSTHVTARLCQQMLRDVIKVVVDRKVTKDADTGGWSLVYQQEYD